MRTTTQAHQTTTKTWPSTSASAVVTSPQPTLPTSSSTVRMTTMSSLIASRAAAVTSSSRAPATTTISAATSFTTRVLTTHPTAVRPLHCCCQCCSALSCNVCSNETVDDSARCAADTGSSPPTAAPPVVERSTAPNFEAAPRLNGSNIGLIWDSSSTS